MKNSWSSRDRGIKTRPEPKLAPGFWKSWSPSLTNIVPPSSRPSVLVIVDFPIALSLHARRSAMTLRLSRTQGRHVISLMTFVSALFVSRQLHITVGDLPICSGDEALDVCAHSTFVVSAASRNLCSHSQEEFPTACCRSKSLWHSGGYRPCEL